MTSRSSLVAAALLAALLASGADRAPTPGTHALLINGGGAPARNYLSHFHHLQDLRGALRERGVPADRIHVFSADGEDAKPDLASRATEPEDSFLLEGTGYANALFENAITSSVWEGVTLHPARLSELRRFFSRMRKELGPGDTLLVFVTDHGTQDSEDPEHAFINLWNESLSVLEFRALVGSLKPGVRVIAVMSQCYSGAFADAMTPLQEDFPRGDFCGLYSTERKRPAYGCYPEGRDRDRIGHAFRFIDALGRYASTDDVHASVLVSDTTPDVPLRTSDVYLEGVVAAEAARRGVQVEVLADELLTRAFRQRARWEREIRLLDRIGEVYGTFSPRTLAELGTRIAILTALSEELDTYQDRWRLALNDLRRENLARFLEANAEWGERLADRKLAALDPAARKQTLSELLPALRSFTAAKPEVLERLESLRDQEADAGSGRYRVDVRLSALLRMRYLLMRIAGTQLLAGDPRAPAAQALAALEACERVTIGSVVRPDGPFPPQAPEILPPFEEDLAAVRRALPSWLGIRFRPVPEGERERLQVERGAVVVEQVYEDSPASAAGIQRGDLLLGPEGKPFVEPSQIREWIMTSPRGEPRSLELLREGERSHVEISLVAMPSKLPALPAPPKAGDDAPALGSLKMVRPDAAEAVQVSGRHVLFFWATWCGPCKAAVPELMEWGRKNDTRIVAVSDEDPDTIRSFLDGYEAPFPEAVASDPLRLTNAAYGVSGTPTFVLVDASGKIVGRQVGYSREKGLKFTH